MKLRIEAQKNPSVNTNLDYNLSLHTRTRQRSNYIRVDDNPTNFDFKKNMFSFLFDEKQLSEDKIMQMKEELNRIHIKFSGEEQAHQRRRTLLDGYHMFLQQLVNMRNKNIRLGLSERVDNMIERNYDVKSFTEYRFKKWYIEQRIKKTIRKQMNLEKKEK